MSRRAYHNPQQDDTPRDASAIQRVLDIWMPEHGRLADKDLAVIIMAHAGATARTDPTGWLWQQLARGELRSRRWKAGLR